MITDYYRGFSRGALVGSALGFIAGSLTALLFLLIL